jgi:thiosulfate/3-mercaptopyruvate sulfurtransferase
MMNSMRTLLPVACFTFLAAFCLGEVGPEPWDKTAVVEPAALAEILHGSNPPVIVSVAFPVLYRSKHIVHAIAAGPGSKPEGIDALKKAVADLAKDADIVIYCGCCPMVKCPNLRPAYRTLKEMGFTRIRVLNIPTNMSEDWYSKNYPFEPGSAADH